MNKTILFLISPILFMSQTGKTQTITETFGIGTNAFSIEFVTIGNPGNAADQDSSIYTPGNPNPFGSVNYIYNLGKYEISRDIIEKVNAETGLNLPMADLSYYGRDISPLGSNLPNRPATGLGWYGAAKFVNYLNTSKGYQAAYKFDSNGNFELWDIGQYTGDNQFRHKDAHFFLPSVDEWYKGAYGSPDGSWYWYPTGSNSVPTPVTGGLLYGTAVYGGDGESSPADVTNAGGLSIYGTMAQGGNAWEWTESALDGVNDNIGEYREIRGGAWQQLSVSLNAFDRSTLYPESELGSVGVRVAMVPEPSALSLLAVGLGGLAILRQGRKKD